MTSTAIGRPAGIPLVSAYGLITSTTEGLGDISSLVGGDGSVRWKQVINGMHLPGGWNCVEFVEIPPGASCGRHLHAATEEIYYILSGAAEMHVNGEDFDVRAGDLITCPIGTVHGIRVPAAAAGMMTFLVVEVFPGAGPPGTPARIAVRDQLRGTAGYRGHAGDELDVAWIDLTPHFTGPWRRFTELKIPPDDAVGPYSVPARAAEVLFVAAGEAEITADGQVLKGGPGLCVGAPLASEVTVRNASGERDLRVLSVEVGT